MDCSIISNSHNRSSIEHYDLNYEEFDTLIEGIDGRTTLIGPEKQKFRIDRFSQKGLSLDVVLEGGANIFEGNALANSYGLAFGMATHGAITANGATMDSNHMAVYREGDALTSYCSNVSRYVLINFHSDLLESLLAHSDPIVTETILKGPCVQQIEKEKWLRTVTMVNRVLDRATEKDLLANPSLLQAALKDVTQSALDALSRTGNETHTSGRPRLPRQEVIARTLEALHSNAYFMYSIREMADYAGVSDRMFRRICKERFGINPKKYVMLRQMQDIRLELKRASPGDRVSQIAAKFGVWDWGRFAARYRQVYGEAPSQTLDRSVV